MNWNYRNQLQRSIRQFVDVGKRLDAKEYVAANDGNLSIRLDDSFLATESGAVLGRLTPVNILVVNHEGIQIPSQYHLQTSNESRVTSEWKMHAAIYQSRPDVNAIVHAHPPFSTAWSITQRDFPEQYLPETAILLKKIPVVPYSMPSSMELAESVAKKLETTNTVLLANHGAVAIAENLQEAMDHMERLEHSVKIVMIAMLTNHAIPLNENQMRELSLLVSKL